MSTNVTTYAVLVGQSLAWHRQMRGLEQVAIAQYVGVGQPTWSKIERGESALTVEQLARAATALQTSPSEILRTADHGAHRALAQGIKVVAGRSEELSPAAVFLSVAGVALLIAGIMSK